MPPPPKKKNEKSPEFGPNKSIKVNLKLPFVNGNGYKMSLLFTEKKGGVKKEEKKVPTAFANFFTKSAAAKPETTKKGPNKVKGKSKKTTEKHATDKKGQKKGKIDDSKTVGNSEAKKGLNLSSTSLILFEDVSYHNQIQFMVYSLFLGESHRKDLHNIE